MLYDVFVSLYTNGVIRCTPPRHIINIGYPKLRPNLNFANFRRFFVLELGLIVGTGQTDRQTDCNATLDALLGLGYIIIIIIIITPYKVCLVKIIN